MRKLGASIAAFTLAMANWVDCTPASLRAADPPSILPRIISGDHYPYYLLADPQAIPTATRTDHGRSIFDWSSGCGSYRGYCPAPAATSDIEADYEGCPEADDSAKADVAAQDNTFSDDSEYNAEWSAEYATPKTEDVADSDESDWSSDEESLYRGDSSDEDTADVDAQIVSDYEEDAELTDGETNTDSDVPPPVADASIYDEDWYGEGNTPEQAPAAETAADSDFYNDEYGDYEEYAPTAPAVTESADVDADYEGYGDYSGEYDAAAELAPIDETAPAADADAVESDDLASVVDAWPSLPAPVKSVIMAMVKISGSVR